MVNPLINWSRADLDAYVASNDVPLNRLLSQEGLPGTPAPLTTP